MTERRVIWPDPPFRWLWLAESVTKLGDAVSFVALPLAAIIALAASPVEVGLLGAAQFLPILLFGLPAGAWVDRQRRLRGVMIRGDWIRAISLASVPIAHLLGGLTIWQLYAVAFVNAAVGAFTDVALASYVPSVVPTGHLVQANAKLELSRSAVQVIGPGLAGVAIGAVGAPVALALDALSFAGSAVALGRIREGGRVARTFEQRAQADRLPRRSIGSELADGLRFVRHQPQVRAVVATATINNLSRSIGLAVLLLYLTREAGVPALDIGLAFGLGNIGFLVGAVLGPTITARVGVGPVMLAGVGCFGPGMLLVAIAPPATALAATTVMLFANGVGIAVHTINQVSLRQTLTPPELRGRVAAVNRMLIFGALPLGTMLGGLFGELFGLRAPLWLSAAGLFAGTLPYLLSGTHRIRRLPDAVETGEPLRIDEEPTETVAS